ncbi:MAG: hypothetical protein CR972_02425 [Candidatus Moraniibacteriota bacterium]|nr:MAG: hypothetical protein CR972_02425 [Candidatus Moranbacteria bacterium]
MKWRCEMVRLNKFDIVLSIVFYGICFGMYFTNFGVSTKIAFFVFVALLVLYEFTNPIVHLPMLTVKATERIKIGSVVVLIVSEISTFALMFLDLCNLGYVMHVSNVLLGLAFVLIVVFIVSWLQRRKVVACQ